MALTEAQKRHAAKHRDNIRRIIREAKGDTCLDCKHKYPHYILEFDHVRGEKRFVIGTAGARGVKTVLEEIEKCDVICANCHNVRTYERLSFSSPTWQRRPV